MKLRQLLVGLTAGSWILIAGCGSEGLGPLDYAIPDGTYAGTLSLTASFWQNGVDDGQDFDEWDATRTFKTGDLINKVTGDWFYWGDQDTLDLGSLQVARVVTDVEQFDWGYHVLFDVTGSWDDVPVSGKQDVDYILEYDGSVSVEDTMELTSLQEYDGGAWEIEVYVEGNLVRAGGGSGDDSGNGGDNGEDGLPPWFDDKSGKIRIGPVIHPIVFEPREIKLDRESGERKGLRDLR
jgi:hypothetical protein